MKREIKVVGKNTVQITLEDERYYKHKKTYAPSNTWVVSTYPKGKYFLQWVALNGYEQSQLIMHEKAERGSRLHQAIENLLNGDQLAHDAPVMRGEDSLGEMPADEWKAITDWLSWWKEFIQDKKVEILAIEESYIYKSKNITFGTTVDFVVRIDNVIWIIDWKSGKNIFEPYRLQMTGIYKALLQNKVIKKTDDVMLGIFQVGYTGNKRGWKMNEITLNWELYRAIYKVFLNENKVNGPRQLDLPLTLSLH